MSDSSCKFYKCGWIGPLEQLYEHCETYHRQYIREIIGGSRFDFKLEELQMETFLLSTDDGLYWFLQKNSDTENIANEEFSLKKGIFRIADSEIVEYTIKFGTVVAGRASYLGPYKVEEESSEKYSFQLTAEYLVYLQTQFEPKMSIYFGEVHDEDDKYIGDWQFVNWDEREEEANAKMLQLFTCSVCLEHIRNEARFCENKHYMCVGCFNSLQVAKGISKRCPTCRGVFTYDCVCANVNNLLKILKYPDASMES